MTFAEYLQQVNQAKLDHPQWRKGQSFFNVLAEVRPDLSEPLRGGEFDPFHRDEVIREFLQQISEKW